MIDKKQQLIDFAKAVAIPVGLTDSIKWPVRAGTVIFPVRNIFVKEFFSQINEAGLHGNQNKWREAFYGPTQLWRMSHHLVNGLVDEDVDQSDIAEKILLFLEGISALNNNHYFEHIGKHFILADSDVSKTITVDMHDNKKEARKALMLAGLLWSYSETNYFVAHELTCEYHGAYTLPDGNFAVIREFMNLRPIELWSNRDYGSLPDFLRIITIHDSSLNIGFDVYNNLFDEKGTMATSLLKSAVCTSDNRSLSYDEILSLISSFSAKVETFTVEVETMSNSDIARKYTEVFWYRKKSLTDYIGITWKPSEEIYKILEKGLEQGPKKKAIVISSGNNLVDELISQYDFSVHLKT
ncbi:MAG: hypothetical protein FWG98_10425 [Candidatus Cloacimonetes bacterium]|nr:hypothetical protein [Candidatus Cloacimonadota bacterium]